MCMRMCVCVYVLCVGVVVIRGWLHLVTMNLCDVMMAGMLCYYNSSKPGK